jgi:quinol-cytochrome oxidoreductase complex cytochrome b subunit/mono/diheme cytochrome c family protein
VIAAFFNWLDHRSGYRKFIAAMLLEDIPGGARWRYVWGSTLVFVFSIQLITGILLMTAYSPGDTSAWASVHFIQYQMDFGWFIRGLHHFGSQTMMVLIALHMLQVVIAGAHLPPREVNWWLGLGLLGVTFGMSLTGYLLPWDQKGYWATRVATNIASNTPMIGDFLKKMLLGGDEYGNQTLTRFFALHVAILPLTLIVLMVAHIALFRRHGVTAPLKAEGEEYFWPGQAFKDLIMCLVVFGVMVGLVIWGHGNPVDVPEDRQPQGLYQTWAHAGQQGKGANLDAPADRDTSDYPARPEWYFLFLFQLLKYFPGDKEIIGTFVIPNAVMALLAILPLLGFGPMRKFGYWISVIVIVALFLCVGGLTLLALADDSPEYAPQAAKLLGVYAEKDAEKHGVEKAKEMAQERAREKAEEFVKKTAAAEVKATRAANLAMAGVPDTGATTLLRTDPLTRGNEVFKTNCASCHAFTVSKEEEEKYGWYGLESYPRNKDRKASDLGNWGTAAWVRGLLANPADPHYFGGMEQLDGMKQWKEDVQAERGSMNEQQIKEKDKEYDQIAAWVADQRSKDAPGKELFKNQCGRCHRAGDVGTTKVGRAPDLTGWGSAAWIRGMILAPAHESRYGKYYKDAETRKGLMPAFVDPNAPGARQALQERNPGLPDTMVMQLSDTDREAVIRFMLRDYRVVFGGTTISAAPK